MLLLAGVLPRYITFPRLFHPAAHHSWTTWLLGSSSLACPRAAIKKGMQLTEERVDFTTSSVVCSILVWCDFERGAEQCSEMDCHGLVSVIYSPSCPCSDLVGLLWTGKYTKDTLQCYYKMQQYHESNPRRRTTSLHICM